MKLQTGIKAGTLHEQHNEKLAKRPKALKTKLRLVKETVKELKNSDLRRIAGGIPYSAFTSCHSNCDRC